MYSFLLFYFDFIFIFIEVFLYYEMLGNDATVDVFLEVRNKRMRRCGSKWWVGVNCTV